MPLTPGNLALVAIITVTALLVLGALSGMKSTRATSTAIRRGRRMPVHVPRERGTPPPKTYTAYRARQGRKYQGRHRH